MTHVLADTVIAQQRQRRQERARRITLDREGIDMTGRDDPDIFLRTKALDILAASC